MNCWRHRDRATVGVCAACGKGLCGEDCARDDSAIGLHCDEACAARLRRQARSGDAPVGLGWSSMLLVLGALLLFYGYRYSEWTMSVPNLLGMLFVWYGVVLLLQRFAQRRRPSP